MTGVCRGGRGESGHGLFVHRSKQTLIIVFVCLFAYTRRGGGKFVNKHDGEAVNILCVCVVPTIQPSRSLIAASLSIHITYTGYFDAQIMNLLSTRIL